MSRFTALFVAVAATLSVSAAAVAGTGPAVGAQAAKTYSFTLSSSERGAAIGKFVRKWGPYVQKVYGLDVRTWSERMVPQFAKGDAVNIQRALERSTFDGAMAELDGVGHKLSDDQAITKLAASSLTATKGTIGPSVLGASGNDLVYTSITPCRLVDTRLAGGPIAAGTSRGLKAWGYANYTDQGGAATDCGVNFVKPTALELNVTAVFPTGAGYATVFSGALASPPLSASINYVAGAIVNNALVSVVGNIPDLKIFTYAQSHYVVDVVGYYAPPIATALDCVSTTLPATNVAAAATFNLALPACGTGYTMTGAGCRTSGYADADWAINGIWQATGSAFCAGKNKTGGNITVEGATRCCRVPGR